MLKDFVKAVEPDEEELKKELKEAQEKLASYQMEIKNAKLPVIVIFEGWGAAICWRSRRRANSHFSTLSG